MKRDVAVKTLDLAGSHFPHPAAGGREVMDKMIGMERTQIDNRAGRSVVWTQMLEERDVAPHTGEPEARGETSCGHSYVGTGEIIPPRGSQS